MKPHGRAGGAPAWGRGGSKQIMFCVGAKYGEGLPLLGMPTVHTHFPHSQPHGLAIFQFLRVRTDVRSVAFRSYELWIDARNCRVDTT